MTITVLILFVPVLVMILLLLNVLLAVHKPDTEKVTPYECGFNPIFNQVRAPFAIQYYLVGILLTVGFVYEFGKGALYFTDHRSSISRAVIERP